MAEYVDNKKLYTEMVKWKTKCNDAAEAGEPRPEIPNYIAVCFMKIAENLARLPKFNGYSYKEDMIAEGVMTCVRYADRFDPDKSTFPFSYFSTICTRAFWAVRKKEQTQGKIQKALIMDSGILSDVSDLHEHDDALYTSGFIEQIEKYVDPDDMEKINNERSYKGTKNRRPRTKVVDSNLDALFGEE